MTKEQIFQMTKEQLLQQIIKQLKVCKDENLLDLILKLLLESSY